MFMYCCDCHVAYVLYAVCPRCENEDMICFLETLIELVQLFACDDSDEDFYL